MKKLKKFLSLTISSLALTFASLSHAMEPNRASMNGDFTLLNAKGETVSQEILNDHLSLVYFGYTSCMMQCPPSWITLDTVMNELGPEIEDLQVLFISIDPKRDTVEKIAEWQKTWPNLTVLTGSSEQIEKVADIFHIFYARKPMHAMPFAKDQMMRIAEEYQADQRLNWGAKKPAGYYMMDHTTQVFLLGRDHHYITHFEYEEPPELIIDFISKQPSQSAK